MVEMLDALIPQEDADATSELRKSFARRGIVVHLGKQCTKVEDTESGLVVHFGEGETTSATSCSSRSAGRRSSTASASRLRA